MAVLEEGMSKSVVIVTLVYVGKVIRDQIDLRKGYSHI